MSHELVSLGLAGTLAAVHLFGGRLRFLDRVPRSVLLSAFGGVSVAYVVMHLLPDIGEAQETLADATSGVWPSVERHAYALVLVGLVAYYTLEQVARRSVRRGQEDDGPAGSTPGVFAVSIVGFAAYNLLVGHLLVDRAKHARTTDVYVFALALALHFVVNDFGLRSHHRRRYDVVGRWLLAAAVLGGWGVGVATGGVSEAAVATIAAFLAGGIIVNVLKEELPEDRRSRPAAFAIGAAAYAALLLLVP